MGVHHLLSGWHLNKPFFSHRPQPLEDWLSKWQASKPGFAIRIWQATPEALSASCGRLTLCQDCTWGFPELWSGSFKSQGLSLSLSQHQLGFYK